MTLSQMPADQPATARRPWLPGPAALLAGTLALYIVAVLFLASRRHGEVEPVLFARLEATGHMAEFSDLVRDRTPPANAWARARDWQRFELPEQHGLYRQIAREVGRYDAHPPFFFWAMHTLLNAGVSSHWVTTAINLPGAVATGLLIVAFTGYCVGDAWCAALAGACWFLSPTVMLIGDNVRSPTLFALLTLLTIWLVLDWQRVAARGTAWRMAGAIALALLGMLNHFNMAIVLAGCGLFLLGQDRRAFVAFSAAVVIAAGLFLLVHPAAFQSLAVNKQVNIYEPFSAVALARRAVNLAVGLFHYFAIEPKWTRAMTLIIPLTLGLAWIGRRHRAVAERPPYSGRPARLAMLAGVLLALHAVMYLLWLLPFHAYGALYVPGLLVLTPVAMAIGLRFWVGRPAFVGLLLGVLAVSSIGSTRLWLRLYGDARVSYAAIARSDLLLTDAVQIHGIPRYVEPANPDAWVLAASRDRLADTIRTALSAGLKLAVVLDGVEPPTPTDHLGVVIADAMATGRLRRDHGLDYFSPGFDLLVTPSALPNGKSASVRSGP